MNEVRKIEQIETFEMEVNCEELKKIVAFYKTPTSDFLIWLTNLIQFNCFNISFVFHRDFIIIA